MSTLTYRIARDGQTYGPYSLAEVREHLTAGRVVASDLAQPLGGEEWLPVADVFPTTPMRDVPTHPGGLPTLFPDPPDLHWAWLLVLSLVTLNIFTVVWDVYEAVWMRRVDARSRALWPYAALAILFVAKVPSNWHTILFNLGLGPRPSEAGSWVLTALTVILAIVARLTLRRELLRHFNGPEPIGLQLNWFWSLVFGGLYYQFHMNRVNAIKRTLRISVPS